MDPADFAGLEGTPPAWVQELIGGTASAGGYGGEFSGSSDQTWPIWLIVLASVTLPVGFLANGWILVRVLREKKLRTSSFHLLLMKHCIASMLLCSFVYPIISYRSSTGLPTNTSQVNLCRVSSFLLLWWVSATLFNHGVVAINRALSCYPYRAISGKLRGLKGTCCLIAVNWSLSFLLYIIPATFYSVGWASAFACEQLKDLIKHALTNEKKSVQKCMRFEFGLTILLVLLVILISYAIIMSHLFGHTKTGQATKESQKRRKEKIHALGVIALVFAVFLLCWMPFMWVVLYETKLLLDRPIFGYLPMLEMMLNPFVYMVCMPVFRPVLCCRHQGRIEPLPSGPTNVRSVSAKVETPPKTMSSLQT